MKEGQTDDIESISNTIPCSYPIKSKKIEVEILNVGLLEW
jgi:hypothetical protein